MSDNTVTHQMRSFDHDGKRWWVYGDASGAVSISALHVPEDFRWMVSPRNPHGPGRLFPECVTYHRPVPAGTEWAEEGCPALNGEPCDPDAGQDVRYILSQWELLGYADQYLEDTLASLYQRAFGGAR